MLAVGGLVLSLSKNSLAEQFYPFGQLLQSFVCLLLSSLSSYTSFQTKRRHKMAEVTFKDSMGRPTRIEVARFEAADGRTVIILKDLNAGMSVTNACEYFAMQAAVLYAIGNPEDVVWVEVDSEGGFELLTFDWEDGEASNPRWSHLSQKDMYLLITHPVLLARNVEGEGD